MSDVVPEAAKDNTNSDVDSLASLTTATVTAPLSLTQTIISDTELDDDFFVCRKCNKVFKDLSEYLEHKIKDENFRLSKMRSKGDKKMVIPKLVEKKKRTWQGKSKETSAKGSNDTEIGDNGEGDGDIKPPQAKAGRKRKAQSSLPEATAVLGKENVCSVCGHTFRRAASLRWHLRYDHDEDEDKSDDSDREEKAVLETETDGDFQPKDEVEKERAPKTLTVTVKEKSSIAGRDKKIPNITFLPEWADSNQQCSIEDYRPYICDICGKGFKELTVCKGHLIVHSNERNFVCPVEGCPYSFKTKGCLVRHMRRHTGERPFDCEKCGRSFTESGALSRHLKSRRNCAQVPDSQYPRYKKKWNYHPNIEAVTKENMRDTVIGSQDPLGEDLYRDGGSLELVVTGLPNGGFSGAKNVEKNESESLDEIGNFFKTQNIQANLETSVSHSDSLSQRGALSSSDSKIVIMGAENTNTNAVPESLSENDTRTHLLPDPFSANNIKISAMPDTPNLLLQCQVCKKDFAQSELLEVHLHSHLAYYPSNCGLCHFLAQNREDMRQHILTMHGESLNDVEAMLYTVDMKSDFESAKEKDQRVAQREALLAVRQLQQLKSMRLNMAGSKHTSSTTGSAECLICHRMFKGVNYMRKHMRIHTGERPFKCDHCDATFVSKDVLKKHMYVHSDQRDYKCGECGKMFKRLIHVEQHLKTHSQERSFKCSICEKLFKTRNSLKVHLRTHTNINPYRCQVCNRHFRERGSLQRHMRLHTGEKPFQCPHCSKRFSEHGTLSRHLKAKVPCSSYLGQVPNTRLAQFSSMVADSQYILPAVSNEELVTNDVIVISTGEEDSQKVMEKVKVIVEENAVADTQEQPVTLSSNDGIDQSFGEDTESIQVYNATTGESVIITADKSIIDLVKSQQVSFDSSADGFNVDSIHALLMAAAQQNDDETTDSGELEHGFGQGQVFANQEMIIAGPEGEIVQNHEILIHGMESEIADNQGNADANCQPGHSQDQENVAGNSYQDVNASVADSDVNLDISCEQGKLELVKE